MTSPVHLPPVNLRLVVEGVFRSGCPDEKNFSYLETLNLKTVVTLVNEKCPKFREYLKANGTTHHTIVMAGTKEGVCNETMEAVMKILLDTSNYPVLVHCNQGKHRTGCVVGTMSKLKSWDTARIVDEYSSIAAPKVRPCDVKYMEGLDLEVLGVRMFRLL